MDHIAEPKVWVLGMSYLHRCSSPLRVLGLLRTPLSAYSAITTHLISLRVEKRASAGTEVFTAKRHSSRLQLKGGGLGAPLGRLVSPLLVLWQPQFCPVQLCCRDPERQARRRRQLRVACLNVSTCADTFTYKGVHVKFDWATVWSQVWLDWMA